MQDVAPADPSDAYHFPHSRLVMMENTHNRGSGAVWPLPRRCSASPGSPPAQLKLHLDGARLECASRNRRYDEGLYPPRSTRSHAAFPRGWVHPWA